jgi:DNA-binding HxlR family transcriptional regulator
LFLSCEIVGFQFTKVKYGLFAYSIYYVYHKEMPRSDISCPAQRTLVLIGGRWKIPILYYLGGRTCRFSELRRLLSPVTPKMLAQQLREMERDGLVRRKQYAEIPPKVEYSLTAMGRSLEPIIGEMCRWGGRCGKGK